MIKVSGQGLDGERAPCMYVRGQQGRAHLCLFMDGFQRPLEHPQALSQDGLLDAVAVRLKHPILLKVYHLSKEEG